MTTGSVDREFELPLASVARICKRRLGVNATVTREAKIALAKSAGIFVMYLTAASHECCKDSKRQTLSTKDVLEALTAVNFEELLPPLEQFLLEVRSGERVKGKKTTTLTAAGKEKRKAEGKDVEKGKAEGKDSDKSGPQQTGANMQVDEEGGKPSAPEVSTGVVQKPVATEKEKSPPKVSAASLTNPNTTSPNATAEPSLDKQVKTPSQPIQVTERETQAAAQEASKQSEATKPSSPSKKPTETIPKLAEGPAPTTVPISEPSEPTTTPAANALATESAKASGEETTSPAPMPVPSETLEKPEVSNPTHKTGPQPTSTSQGDGRDEAMPEAKRALEGAVGEEPVNK
eukprot:CAMPEP_0184541302 /NCGR_PEP_ID=MMETSP0199_2-20130426/1299_1 /TAXON_ID=1112570 /ORGANISM="Thraustochytrium sp., Strain LLF1b" /LENGTH=346 /DNA_ID=CAMNT_0026935015 /DNA_START=41 /DNA_END=1078 /DNA_ORIENTATION=-